MSVFDDTIAAHKDDVVSYENQVALGKPRSAHLRDDEHVFIKVVISLLEQGKIDPDVPATFIKKEEYEKLSDEGRRVTDEALPNISSLLRRIVDLHYRKEPDDSFEMASFIASLWHAKSRVEEWGDVFVF